MVVPRGGRDYSPYLLTSNGDLVRAFAEVGKLGKALGYPSVRRFLWPITASAWLTGADDGCTGVKQGVVD